MYVNNVQIVVEIKHALDKIKELYNLQNNRIDSTYGKCGGGQPTLANVGRMERNQKFNIGRIMNNFFCFSLLFCGIALTHFDLTKFETNQEQSCQRQMMLDTTTGTPSNAVRIGIVLQTNLLAFYF